MYICCFFNCLILLPMVSLLFRMKWDYKRVLNLTLTQQGRKA